MKDNFSHNASDYARFRPVYPQALYDFLLERVPGRRAAWDCGTGNGQVATVLAAYFETVAATDISAQQLEQAVPHPRIHYAVGSAETPVFADASFDLITVAQAVHWFDFDRFYPQVRRVLRPGGVLALWGYGVLQSDPPFNAAIHTFYTDVIGPYWDAERSHIDAAYQTIPFPLTEIPAPAFQMPYRWTRAHLQGYLGTWSAVQHFIRQKGYDPVSVFMGGLGDVWPEGVEKEVVFPVFMRVGVVYF